MADSAYLERCEMRVWGRVERAGVMVRWRWIGRLGEAGLLGNIVRLLSELFTLVEVGELGELGVVQQVLCESLCLIGASPARQPGIGHLHARLGNKHRILESKD
jgi:hypothetical protein